MGSEMLMDEVVEMQECVQGAFLIRGEPPLGFTELAQARLQDRNIKRLLAAEVMVDHPGIELGPLGDLVDAGTGIAFGGKLDRRRIQDALAGLIRITGDWGLAGTAAGGQRSEEHTSELQSLMRISYAVFCLKKKK